jgi:hypothetical protein
MENAMRHIDKRPVPAVEFCFPVFDVLLSVTLLVKNLLYGQQLATGLDWEGCLEKVSTGVDTRRGKLKRAVV